MLRLGLAYQSGVRECRNAEIVVSPCMKLIGERVDDVRKAKCSRQTEAKSSSKDTCRRKNQESSESEQAVSRTTTTVDGKGISSVWTPKNLPSLQSWARRLQAVNWVNRVCKSTLLDHEAHRKAAGNDTPDPEGF